MWKNMWIPYVNFTCCFTGMDYVKSHVKTFIHLTLSFTCMWNRNTLWKTMWIQSWVKILKIYIYILALTDDMCKKKSDRCFLKITRLVKFGESSYKVCFPFERKSGCEDPNFSVLFFVFSMRAQWNPACAPLTKQLRQFLTLKETVNKELWKRLCRSSILALWDQFKHASVL